VFGEPKDEEMRYLEQKLGLSRSHSKSARAAAKRKLHAEYEMDGIDFLTDFLDEAEAKIADHIGKGTAAAGSAADSGDSGSGSDGDGLADGGEGESDGDGSGSDDGAADGDEVDAEDVDYDDDEGSGEDGAGDADADEEDDGEAGDEPPPKRPRLTPLQRLAVEKGVDQDDDGGGGDDDGDDGEGEGDDADGDSDGDGDAEMADTADAGAAADEKRPAVRGPRKLYGENDTPAIPLAAPQKYIPPHLRKAMAAAEGKGSDAAASAAAAGVGADANSGGATSLSDHPSRPMVLKELKSRLNRLSEQNIEAIAAEVKQLFEQYQRRGLSAALFAAARD
jgi:hypothetical protein